jgi:glucan 1,3-beta-glucosidase
VAILTLLVSIVTALGLVFDPRYRDFPFAPLTAAIVPFFVHSVFMPRPTGSRGVTEVGGALILAASALYIVPNETVHNWQALWLGALLVLSAISLVRVRVAQS